MTLDELKDTLLHGGHGVGGPLSPALAEWTLCFVEEYALAEYNKGVLDGVEMQQEAQMYDEMNRTEG